MRPPGMAQTNALESLIGFARGQRDDALSRFVTALSASRAVADQLALLISYRGEYAARMAASVHTGLTVEQLRGFRLFLDKLDVAIAQQQQAVQSQSEQQQQRRADWALTESKLQGYDTLRKRRHAQQAIHLRRTEQRASDEHGRLAKPRMHDDS